MQVGDTSMREDVALASTTQDDEEEWRIPEDRLPLEADNAWPVVVDDWAVENEHRFQYPAGLP